MNPRKRNQLCKPEFLSALACLRQVEQLLLNLRTQQSAFSCVAVMADQEYESSDKNNETSSGSVFQFHD